MEIPQNEPMETADKMKRVKTLLTLLLVLSFSLQGVYAQSEKKDVRKGNKEFKKEQYLDSEISYRSALEQNKESYKARFNLGDALYKQDKYEEAGSTFEGLTQGDASQKKRADAYYNLGNSFFKNQQLEESIQAYKEALRLNPNDFETKYNLSQALRLVEQQENQENQNQQNEGDGEGDEDQQDQQQNPDENEDEQDQNQENSQDDQQQQQQEEREQQISPEDAQRMLDAIQDKEKEIQERLKEEKAKEAKVKVEKNW